MMAEYKPCKHFRCGWMPLDGDPEGLCLLHSRDLDKDYEAFLAVLIAIWNLRDPKGHYFLGVFFPHNFDPFILFGTRSFPIPVFFESAIFREKAVFLEATFTQKASFQDATFAGDADFIRATFSQEAFFHRATFVRGAEFDNATFSGEAVFSWTTFEEEARFYSATIAGQVIFWKINYKEKERLSLPFRGDFRNLRFQGQGLLRFQDLSLAQVQFAGSDLRRLQFHNVTWHEYRGRQTLYDEYLLRQKELSLAKRIFSFVGLVSVPEQTPPTRDEYGEVERLYRNLEITYESENDYKSSGDFHYGEMEMHRRANPGQLWYQFYWALSGYGERPLRSLLVLWGFFLALSGVFFWLEPSLPGGHTWGGLGNAILYVFQKGTLQRPDPNWLENASSLSKFFAAIIPVLIPGQVALFFLALRNRLGRRR